MAEKDSLRPCRSDTAKWPPNRHLRRQNRAGFSARHGNQRKCFAPAPTPAFPPTTNRPSHCRSAPCGNTPSGGAGPLPCNQRGRFGRIAAATAGEVAGRRAPPRCRSGVGMAIRSLASIGGGPAGNSAGTRSPRRRFRFPDGGAGSDDTSRSGHGRITRCLRRVRARDSTGASARRIGPCPAERQEVGPAANSRTPN